MTVRRIIIPGELASGMKISLLILLMFTPQAKKIITSTVLKMLVLIQ